LLFKNVKGVFWFLVALLVKKSNIKQQRQTRRKQKKQKTTKTEESKKQQRSKTHLAFSFSSHTEPLELRLNNKSRLFYTLPKV